MYTGGYVDDLESEATGIGVGCGLITNVKRQSGLHGQHMLLNEDYDLEAEFLSGFVGLRRLYRMSKKESDYAGRL